MGMAVLSQDLMNPGAAISVAAGFKFLLDQRRQLLVLAGAHTGSGLPLQPGIIGAGRNLQRPAQGSDRVLGFHELNALVSLLGESERMPKVFFKMSRCWRSCWFSRRIRASSCSSCWCERFLSSGT